MNTVSPSAEAIDLGFKELERFVAVIEYGGLAEAAKVLGLTQQALGRSLTKLEKTVGTKLLHRSQGNQTRPTLYGEAFLPYAKGNLHNMSRALQHVQSLAGARSGSVALGIGETCDVQALSEVVMRFHDEQPGVQIDLLEDYTEALLSKLVEGELDCVIGALPEVEYTRRGVVYESLYDIDDVILARAQHPLLRKKKLTLKDLQGYTWLVARRRTDDWITIRDAFLNENLKPPQGVIRSDAPNLGLQLMLADDYLLMLSPTFLNIGARDSALKRLPINKPTVRRRSGLMTMEHRQLNPATQELMRVIREASHSP
ncbi:MAG: LysR family transcriptional regulator [Congregibacter sp.]